MEKRHRQAVFEKRRGQAVWEKRRRQENPEKGNRRIRGLAETAARTRQDRRGEGEGSIREGRKGSIREGRKGSMGGRRGDKRAEGA